MAEGRSRPAWAEIDLDALRHNVDLLRRVSAPAQLWAVVKADGYGHGATAVARAALEAGAAGVAVALVDEGLELRQAGVSRPVLLLSDPPADAAEALVGGELTPTVSTFDTLHHLAVAAKIRGVRLPVHVKVDTGMHRVGVSVSEAAALVTAVAEEPALRLEGLWTHLAVADGPGEEERRFTARQLAQFDAIVSAATAAGARPALCHAANSAGAIAWPTSRYDLVRCGIAIYGQAPSPSVGQALAAATGGGRLRPVLSLRARVSAVRRLEAGARPSYGRRRPLPHEAVVATVPLGYADGLPRALFEAGYCVLVGGRRRPLAGMVTMDQIMVDCGPDAEVAPGDVVTLLGRQGDQEITADEWAELLGTINYEVLTGIGPRVPRLVSGAGAPRWST